MSHDKDPYKDTVFLPRTDFPMRADLPTREPAVQERLRARAAGRRAKREGASVFTLHDGPPYANGHLHIGHALNKILKDFVLRSKYAAGFDVPYVPGWDCHGLPIEWKIEEAYRAEGRDKDSVPAEEFRKRCREFAGEWLQVQQREFERLAISDIKNRPYNTMDPQAEAGIVDALLTLAREGALLRRSKPVMWSCVERTAMAEAETEYREKQSPAITVAFPVIGVEDLSVAIWTTTPWTIPANLAVAYHAEFAYGIYETPQGRVIVADKRAAVMLPEARRLADAPDLAGVHLKHPLHALGFADPRALIAADFVTDDAGTGFVHVAPGHGEDDYLLWRTHPERFPERYRDDLPQVIDAEGRFAADVPHFGALPVRVLDDTGKPGGADGAVIKALQEADRLLAKQSIRHSYPHSWRSGAPLIFRNTRQWFIPMDASGLRAGALQALEGVAFYPEAGRNRLQRMVETRPDWVISRQRLWGVPIALFTEQASGKILNNAEIDRRIVELFTEEGADAWFTRPPRDFFPEFDPTRHEQVTDILDVWFDSGVTHRFVQQTHPGRVQIPADLYLEGSDQHRGWFQSSLLAGVALAGRAPYKAVLTHGFVLDEKGEKMSKSRGNTVAPLEVCEGRGADILRLWVATSDYRDDLRVGKTVLEGVSDTYRRQRNTLRWLLGALEGYTDAEAIDDVSAMPAAERYILHRLYETDREVRAAYEKYEFSRAFSLLFHLSTGDLSSLYFDVRKDSLYCDAPGSPKRRACRTVLAHALDFLLTRLAPILVATAEEAWVLRHGEASSVHETLHAPLPEAWHDPDIAAQAERALNVRRAVNVCLEGVRNEKRIGASAEAAPQITLRDPDDLAAFMAFDPPEWCITAPPEVLFDPSAAEAVHVEFAPAAGHKCSRCRRILPEVPEAGAALCGRCADAVGQIAGQESPQA